MQDNKPLELKNVNVDGIIFPLVQAYGVEVKDFRVDHNDEYGFGEGATVITDIDFDIITIEIFGRQNLFDYSHSSWRIVQKHVKNHIMDDKEFMEQWQNILYKE